MSDCLQSEIIESWIRWFIVIDSCVIVDIDAECGLKKLIGKFVVYLGDRKYEMVLCDTCI